MKLFQPLRYLLLLLVFLALAGVVLLYMEKPVEVMIMRTPYSDVIQPAGEVMGNSKWIQVFEVQENDLCRIDIKMATYHRKNTKDVFLEIFGFNDGHTVASYAINAGQVEDNSYLPFRFPALPDSKGQKFGLVISSPSSNSKDAITFWTNPKAEVEVLGPLLIAPLDMPTEKMFKENGEGMGIAVVPGAAILRTYYCTGESLFSRLTADKPELVTANVFRILLSGYFLTLVVILHKLLQ